MVQQIRATLLATGVTPEQFHKAFMDGDAHDKFYAEFHAIDKEFKKIKQTQNEPQGSEAIKA